MRAFFSTFKFFLLPFSAFCIMLFLLWTQVLTATGGHLIYSIDDAYIHLSMASNLMQSGIWGVSFDHFSNSSSSPLWTIILSAFAKQPNGLERIPLLLNCVAAAILLALLWSEAQRRGLSTLISVIFLFCIAYFAPLAPLCFSGMEHLLHQCLVMTLVLWFTREEKPPLLTPVTVILFLALLFTRFESLFIVVPFLLLYFGRKRGSEFVKMGFLTLIPLGVMAFFSLRHEGLWLPNSILLKGSAPGVSTVTIFQFIGKFLRNIVQAPHLSGMVLFALFLFKKERANCIKLKPGSRHLLFIFILSSILHLFFARVGWFYRYEAYLVVLGLSALFLTSPEWQTLFSGGWMRTRGLLAFMLLLAGFLFFRGVEALQLTPKASGNVYEQQYQMGLFLKENFPGASVIANDIGAPSFLGRIHVIDIQGIGHDGVARLRKFWRFSTSDLNDISRKENAVLAIVNDSLFFRQDVFRVSRPLFEKAPFLSFLRRYFIKYGIGTIPASWVKVGEWRLKDNWICESDKVSFYALNAEAAPELSAKLKSFESRLPRGVTAVYH